MPSHGDQAGTPSSKEALAEEQALSGEGAGAGAAPAAEPPSQKKQQHHKHRRSRSRSGAALGGSDESATNNATTVSLEKLENVEIVERSAQEQEPAKVKSTLEKLENVEIMERAAKEGELVKVESSVKLEKVKIMERSAKEEESVKSTTTTTAVSAVAAATTAKKGGRHKNAKRVKKQRRQVAGGAEGGRGEGSKSRKNASQSSAGDGGDVDGSRGGGTGDGSEALLTVRSDDEDDDDEGQSEVECVPTGPCVSCERSELGLSYCKETGRRQEVRCTVVDPTAATAALLDVGGEGPAGRVVGGGVIGDMGSTVKYRSCLHAEEDDIRELVHFWLVMVVLGVVACFGMRRRQQKGGSLYDRRVK